MVSAREMEPIVDDQKEILCQKLDKCARAGKVFDLKVGFVFTYNSIPINNAKEYISFCILGGLGEMAFAKSFNSQITEDSKESTAIRDHILLACAIGQLLFQHIFKMLIAWSP
jgi:hypothetical protein